MKILAAVALAAAVIAAPVAHAETECGYASGYPGVRVSAGNDHTSCDFARAVAAAELTGQHRAFSDVTQEWYSFNCSIERHGSMTCRGGDDFAVIVY